MHLGSPSGPGPRAALSLLAARSPLPDWGRSQLSATGTWSLAETWSGASRGPGPVAFRGRPQVQPLIASPALCTRPAPAPRADPPTHTHRPQKGPGPSETARVSKKRCCACTGCSTSSFISPGWPGPTGCCTKRKTGVSSGSGSDCYREGSELGAEISPSLAKPGWREAGCATGRGVLRGWEEAG